MPKIAEAVRLHQELENQGKLSASSSETTTANSPSLSTKMGIIGSNRGSYQPDQIIGTDFINANVVEGPMRSRVFPVPPNRNQDTISQNNVNKLLSTKVNNAIVTLRTTPNVTGPTITKTQPPTGGSGNGGTGSGNGGGGQKVPKTLGTIQMRNSAPAPINPRLQTQTPIVGPTIIQPRVVGPLPNSPFSVNGQLLLDQLTDGVFARLTGVHPDNTLHKSTGLNAQGSVLGTGDNSNFSFSSTTTSLSFWCVARTLPFPDGTSIVAPAMGSAGSPFWIFTGLTANTTYHFGAYFDMADLTFHLVMSDNSTSLGSLAWLVQTINGDGRYGLFADWQVATPAAGSGGGGGNPGGGGGKGGYF